VIRHDLHMRFSFFTLQRTCKNVKVTFSLRLINHHAMKAYGGVKVYYYALLTVAIVEGESSASRSGRFMPRCGQ
jgi:hypothetical protein